MKKKVLFVMPPVILAAVTLIWLFYKDGRWYYYHQEWQWTPLFVLHLLLPIFYLVMLIVSIVRNAGRGKRESSGVFYIVASIVLMAACAVGLLVFLIFTSGA